MGRPEFVSPVGAVKTDEITYLYLDCGRPSCVMDSNKWTQSCLLYTVCILGSSSTKLSTRISLTSPFPHHASQSPCPYNLQSYYVPSKPSTILSLSPQLVLYHRSIPQYFQATQTCEFWLYSNRAPTKSKSRVPFFDSS